MDSTYDARQLTRSLREAEECLESPLIPGELSSWLEDAKQALLRLDECYQQQIVQVHSPEFADIAREDPELLRRVEQMRDEDKVIREELVAVREHVPRLIARAEAADYDETQVESELDSLVKEGLEVIIRIRVQEAAAKAWHNEALNRDRGVAD